MLKVAALPGFCNAAHCHGHGTSNGTVVYGKPSVARPAVTPGDGWTLELNAGWELRAAKRTGDYIVKRK